ncbi:hypothetical protein AK812_SmicGene8629 [Symbiodinium microadriaticum]|uniref:Uncharacterized protein n=1 Tax=Symbiodinium microadriaticum TaxID=2951 RepID=A0A1Q9EKK8_SYMMI|nr:hypothetical protein AK812_SmicGene8629 [Symbiodinium microadriaticum]
MLPLTRHLEGRGACRTQAVDNMMPSSPWAYEDQVPIARVNWAIRRSDESFMDDFNREDLTFSRVNKICTEGDIPQPQIFGHTELVYFASQGLLRHANGGSQLSTEINALTSRVDVQDVISAIDNAADSMGPRLWYLRLTVPMLASKQRYMQGNNSRGRRFLRAHKDCVSINKMALTVPLKEVTIRAGIRYGLSHFLLTLVRGKADLNWTCVARRYSNYTFYLFTSKREVPVSETVRVPLETELGNITSYLIRNSLV